MLDFDLCARNDIITVPVPCSSMEDRFSEVASPKLLSMLEKTVMAQLAKGVRCKVLFICNPANPQGRCYSAATLANLARFCRKHGMHLVADEVYSMSQYSSGPDSLDPFSSVLSIPEEKPGSLSHVHCLYSLSKDFNMGGLRLGLLVTRNPEIKATMDTVTLAKSPKHLLLHG
jgi:aspartate/methionine/tyrosine aminotransferase